MKDFFQKFTPLQIAGLTVAVLFFGTCAVRYFRPAGNAPVYDIVYQPNGTPAASRETAAPKADRFQQKLTNEPNFRYAERLREASALAVGLSVSEYFDRLKAKRIEHTRLSQIIEAAKLKNILPSEFRALSDTPLGESRMATANGVYYLRYLVNPYALEVVSVGARGAEDGEIFILRVPDAGRVQRKSSNEPEFASASVWIAPLSADVAVPAPFSDSGIFVQSGWRQEAIQINDVQKLK